MFFSRLHRPVRLSVVLPVIILLGCAPEQAEFEDEAFAEARGRDEAGGEQSGRLAFSYRFEGDTCPLFHLDERDFDYGPGSRLTGHISGTVDDRDPDLVHIDAFGPVALHRPSMDLFYFEEISSDEFNAFPPVDEAKEVIAPAMSFSGDSLWFRACPGGFTGEDPEVEGLGMGNTDCPFGWAPGGGFYSSNHPDIPFDFPWVVSAADGTGDADWRKKNKKFCLQGFRVLDRNLESSAPHNWSLVWLPASADIDASAFFGSGTEIGQDVTVDVGATVGEDVSIHQDVVIGASAQVGDNSTIQKGAVLCSGVVVGSHVVIGKNLLIDSDVADGTVLIGVDGSPDASDCP